ncbi:hypothetical protein LTR66_013090 [Elasticomyces elasticus]|nr:hypothetical protein LTR66_013090 [Elasticomyces elasticus]
MSQYSIDLGALDANSKSSTPLPQRQVDKIMSEDVEGPSDFTMNMEKWMRGSVKTTQMQSSSVIEVPLGLEDAQDGDHEKVPENSQHAAQDDQVKDDEGTNEDRDIPEDYPEDDLTLDDSILPPASQDEPDSIWDPDYGTPALPQAKNLLQPTVEDYYSELTPAQRRRVLSAGRTSSPTLSPVRSPVILRRAERPAQAPASAPVTSRNTSTDGTPADSLVHTLHANATRSGSQPAPERAQTPTVPSNRTDQDTIAALKREIEKLQSELSVSRKAEDEAQKASQHHRTELKGLIDAYTTGTRRLQLDLESSRRSRQELEKSLAATRAQRDSSEKDSRAAKAEWNRVAHALQDAEEQHALDVEKIEKLRAEVVDIRDESERLEQKSQDDMRDLQQELALLRLNQDETSQTPDSHQQKAAEAAEALQAQLAQLRQQVQDQPAAITAQLTRFRLEEEAKRASEQQSALDDAKEALQQSQTQLQSIQTECDDALRKLKQTTDELATLKEVHAEVNEALDAKICATLKRREKYWVARMDEMAREREVMAKTLLRQWGREDCGVAAGGAPQEFEYRYAGRR